MQSFFFFSSKFLQKLFHTYRRHKSAAVSLHSGLCSCPERSCGKKPAHRINRNTLCAVCTCEEKACNPCLQQRESRRGGRMWDAAAGWVQSRNAMGRNSKQLTSRGILPVLSSPPRLRDIVSSLKKSLPASLSKGRRLPCSPLWKRGVRGDFLRIIAGHASLCPSLRLKIKNNLIVDQM